MRLPQDLANVLAICILDALWYRPAVAGFLQNCGVPPVLMKDLKELQHQGVPTVKIVHEIYDRLDIFGEGGRPVLRKMLTDMYYWNEIHSIPADRKAQAMASLKELRKAHDRYNAQREFQESREREMHARRTAFKNSAMSSTRSSHSLIGNNVAIDSRIC